ncbi:hypothetical protein GCM10009108_10370 [Castellaniella ginsengisoli]|uniref:Uncharacterized protein n=1 Tax=Castellaniella ginsengisoli TaxID=546114 RepID=A0ABP3W377_9BURK
MAEAQSTHGRGDAAGAPQAADPAGADRSAFRKALAHWPLLAEMDHYLVWHRRAAPPRGDRPNVPQ